MPDQSQTHDHDDQSAAAASEPSTPVGGRTTDQQSEPPTPVGELPSAAATTGSIDQAELDALAAEIEGLTGKTPTPTTGDALPDERVANTPPETNDQPDIPDAVERESPSADPPASKTGKTDAQSAINQSEPDRPTKQAQQPQENAAGAPAADSVGGTQQTSSPGGESAATAANLIDQSELDALTAELQSKDANEAVADGSLTAAANELNAEIDAAVAAAKNDASENDQDGSLAEEMAAAIAAEAASSVASAEPFGGGAVAVAAAPDVKAEPFQAPDLGTEGESGQLADIELLDDVELEVKIELGRTEMYIEDVLQLGVGSVVQLDKAAGDPVDIFVNGRLVARGEVLVLNENFCVRINDILSPIPELENG